MINRKTMLQRRFANGFNKTEVSYPLALENAIERKAQNYKLFGNCRQETREGKSMIDFKSLVTSSVAGVDISYDEDENIIFNGTCTIAWRSCYLAVIDTILKDGQTYTIWQEKGKAPDEISLYSRAYIQIEITNRTNGTKTYIYYTNNFTVNLTKYSYSISIMLGGNGLYTYNNYKNRFMLYKGSEVATEYEKYGVSPSPDYPSEIYSVGDKTINLYNKNLEAEHYYYNASGILVYDASRLFINQTINNVDFEQLTIAFTNKSTGSTVKLCEFTADGTFIRRTLISFAGTYTLNSECSKIILCVDDDDTYNFENLMIEQGSTAHDYVPYGYKIEYNSKNQNSEIVDTITLYLDKPLMALKSNSTDYNLKIGDNYYKADYLDFERQKVVRVNEEITLDGTENWGNSVTVTGFYYRYVYHFSNTIGARTRNINAINSHFDQRILQANGSYEYLMVQRNTTLGEDIYIQSTLFPTVENLKLWLSDQYSNGTPVKVVYQLETPVEEDIVLPDLHTVNGTTVITANTETQPLAIECSYSSKEV